MTAAIITADVVAVRSDSAIDVSRPFAFRIVFPISTLPPQTPPQVGAELPLTVLLDNHHTETAADSATVPSHVARGVAADRAVDDGQTRLATSDATAIGRGEIATDVLLITVRFPGTLPPSV